MALTLNDQQERDLLKTLGLPEAKPGESDVELVIDTIVDLAHQVAELGDPKAPSTIAASAKRAGLEVLDKDTAEALRRDATAGRQAIAAAAKQRVEASVNDAVSDGKITPARKSHWVELITADPGMEQVLASVPKYTAVPMDELGHASPPAYTTGEADHGADGGWFYDS